MSEVFMTVLGADLIRTRHTRRDTDTRVRYSPPDEAGYLWRQIECVLVLITPDDFTEKAVDRELRGQINAGVYADLLFGEKDPDEYYWWRVINTDFNFESSSAGTDEDTRSRIRCIVTVQYTAWERESIYETV